MPPLKYFQRAQLCRIAHIALGLGNNITGYIKGGIPGLIIIVTTATIIPAPQKLEEHDNAHGALLGVQLADALAYFGQGQGWHYFLLWRIFGSGA